MAGVAPNAAWLAATDDGVRIAARVSPRASKNGVVASDTELRIRVTAAPEDGRANTAVIKLLAKQLHCAKGAISIVQGASTRAKVIEIVGLSEVEVARALAS